jgi:hypothetical protein
MRFSSPLVVAQIRCHGAAISTRSTMLSRRISFEPSGRSQNLRTTAGV